MFRSFLKFSDLWIMVALFAAALVVRLGLAAQLSFPQLDDPAGYIQLARHIASGRGLVSDVLWSYWVPFDAVTHPSNEFWMPLGSVLMAVSIRSLGDTLIAAYLPGLIAGALLPPVVYGLGRSLWPQARRWGLLAAVLVVFNAAAIYESVSADSSALYTLLTILALVAAVRAIEQRSMPWAITSGVLCGLSYLARSHGLLLPVTVALVGIAALRREPRIMIKYVSVISASFLVLAVPWWVRNVNVFGTMQPVPLTTIMASPDYARWFNYTNHPTVASMLAGGWPAIIQLRVTALRMALGVIVTMTFPFGLVGLPIGLFRREPLFRMLAWYGILLYLGVSVVLPTAALTGSFYHSAGPFIVWAALGSSIAVRWLFQRPRLRIMAVGVYALFLGLCIGQTLLAATNMVAASHKEGQQFAAIAEWVRQHVPPDQPILTTQAYSLNYSSGYPALTVPVAQDASVLRQVADRYGVRYVVITEHNSLYQAALEQPQARARLIAELPGTWIYELER